MPADRVPEENLTNGEDKRENLPADESENIPRDIPDESSESIPDPDDGSPDDELKRYVKWALIAALAVIIVGVAISAFKGYFHKNPDIEVSGDPGWDAPSYVDVQLIAKNEYSRPGKKLDAVNGIVVHYVANPGSTAEGNRSYFAGLAESGATYASSNFIIGLEGEVLQCVPADEVAYASNNRNSDTLSIECCHPDESGKFAGATYASLVKLCADLCVEFSLDPETDIIRHYDITGKMCPLYFVEHEEEWQSFRADVADAVKTAQTSQK